jgi:flagellar protein FliS
MTTYGRRSAASSYNEQEILNESPLARVARIYDMAGVEIARARTSLAGGKPAVKGAAVARAVRCISLLQSSLNMREGGEVARNLDRLYAYLLRRLMVAHVQNDDAALAEVGRHLSELGSAWRKVADDERSVETAGAAVAVAG